LCAQKEQRKLHRPVSSIFTERGAGGATLRQAGAISVIASTRWVIEGLGEDVGVDSKVGEVMGSVPDSEPHCSDVPLPGSLNCDKNAVNPIAPSEHRQPSSQTSGYERWHNRHFS
jgi:hypothetical protein